MPHNHFAGCIDDWIIDLVHHRARMRGFRADEMPDVEQDLAPEIATFTYDPAKGASRKTALTALIDRRLAMLLRARARRHKRQTVYYALHVRDESSDDHADAHRADDLAMDLQQAIAGLDARERLVCEALLVGTSRLAIARQLQVGRHEVDCIINRIRDQFTATGLQAWLA